MGLPDSFSLTLRQEPRVGLTVVAHRDGAMAEMNHLNDMRVARRRSRMVVITPVHCRCRARGHQSRAFLRSTPVHNPSVMLS